MRIVAFALTLLITAHCFAEEPAVTLPKPHFSPETADPAWIATAVQLHGHLGPWLAAGVRLGAAGVRAVDAKGYFDVEVSVEGPLARPPQACLLDGLQVATGATLGKRNLAWVEASQIAVRVKNLRTGKTATVRPSDAMMKWIASARGVPLSPANKEHATPQSEKQTSNDPHGVDAIARKIAKAPDTAILTERCINK